MAFDFDDFFDSLGDGVVYESKRPKMDSVCFNEIVEMFIHFTVSEMMNESGEMPRFNIIFSDEYGLENY